jgi:ABC-type xylose transport system permease subunit
MAFPRKLKELCTPAFIYFILSVIGILIAAVSNLRSKSNMYTLGNFSTPVPHTGLVFIVKLIYILFFTWVLNLMCKDGHREIAWFLVLLPFVLFLFFIVMMTRPGYEGFKNPEEEEEEEEEEKKEEMIMNEPFANHKVNEKFTTKKTHM